MLQVFQPYMHLGYASLSGIVPACELLLRRFGYYHGHMTSFFARLSGGIAIPPFPIRKFLVNAWLAHHLVQRY